MSDVVIFSAKPKNVFLLLIVFQCFKKVTMAMLFELAFLILILKVAQNKKESPI